VTTNLLPLRRIVLPQATRTVVISVAAAAAASWLHGSHPRLVLLPAVLLAMLPLLLYARARILFLVFGGLFIFQSSSSLDAPKLLFLLGLTFSLAGAVLAARAAGDSSAAQDARPMYYASLAFAGLLAISLPVSMVEGTPHKSWLRDIAPYAIFAAAPLLAVDAQRAFSTRALRHLIILAGAAGTIAFTLRWLTLRGIVTVSSKFGLPTLLLAGALFALAIAAALEGRAKRFQWLLLASVVLTMLLTTGTRSAGVLLAAPLVIVFGARRHLARRVLRLAAIIPVVAVLIVFGVRGFVGATNANGAALGSRIGLFFKTGSASDQSYASRAVQADSAWKVFTHHPLLGQGPGALISWTDASGAVQSGLSIDTPLSYLAKFGALGFFPLIVLVVGFVGVLRNVHRRCGRRTVAQFALLGFGAIVLAYSFLEVPFEEKGISSGLLLLLALVLSEASDGSGDGSHSRAE
jgi:hypothetical protein